MAPIQINGRTIDDASPTYFIADVAANHDGKLERAKRLIRLAAEAGADAAKFQNFQAPKIVSRLGFETLGGQLSHQSRWTRSVFDVYKAASIPFDWTPELKAACDEVGIDYFSSPYDFEAVDMLDAHVPAYKIGSGDITWIEILEYIAGKGKPVILATGASTLDDVVRAVEAIRRINPQLALLQCNTNYTASLENFRHINLNVLNTFRAMYADVVVGLSDHTPGHATVLGAVALGGRIIEKHFTDDVSRDGPDHLFSMTPESWSEMVVRTRELERALGSGVKRVAENELETVIVQRRSLRSTRRLAAGTVLKREDIEVLRPAPADGIAPHDLPALLGRRLRVDVEEAEHFRWDMVDPVTSRA